MTNNPKPAKTSKNAIRAAIYTRISHDPNGQELGVERQDKECRELAGRIRADVVDAFTDNDLSAFNGKTRPGYEAMLKAMAEREFSVLICWHTDRLYRSMKDLERLIDTAQESHVDIRTVNGGDLDLSTSTGKMLARILGSVAHAESEHKGERQRVANMQKAERGAWVTANRCFGYDMNGRLATKEAAAIRTAVADVLAGKSINQVAREWNANGLTGTRGRPWNAPSVRRLLMLPRLAGLRVYRGKVVGPGKWTAIIDPDTHRGLVAFLSDPSRKTNVSFEKKHVGSGIYRCGVCGARMRASQPGGRFAGGRRYECRDNQCVVRVGAPLDELVETVVLELLSASDIRRRLTDDEVDIDALHTRRSALTARLEELAAMFAEGAIDGNQLRRGTTQLRSQVADVDKTLAAAARTSPSANLLKDGTDKLMERWEKASADVRGKIIDELVVVTVNPAPRGPRFDPQYVDIKRRRVAA
jgi:DNA invertase Pin-like site-specific DNA recombinase